MKVYVITQGCYSDYHICAVTLDEQEAERLRKVYDETGDEATVEEFDTEDPEAKLGLDGRVQYCVYFYKSGRTSVSRYWGPAENFRPCVDLDFARDCALVRLHAPDSEAAVKIASEKRAMALAERAGLT